MPMDADSVGYETTPIHYEYDWRDTVLYALGVGATPDDELAFLYEGFGPKVFPTFCTIPTFTVFDALVDRIECDRSGMVHHSQQVTLLKPLRPAAKLVIQGRVDGLYDLKRLAMAVLAIDAYDEDDELAICGEVTLALLKDGRFGGPRPPKAERVHVPDRLPDFESSEMIPPAQALLYRLNGDYNPLHADPAFAATVGFERPIVHGLCTFGYAGRAVVRHVCDGDPDRMPTLRAQFSSPVFPGDTLIIRGWREDERVVLSATTKERPDDTCLTQAYAVVR